MVGILCASNNCKQSWTNTTNHIIISAGECGKGAHWGPTPTQHKFGPRVAPRDQEIIFRRKTLHQSHQIGYYRGAVYCLKCAALSVKRVDSLAKLCKMKPASRLMQCRLKSIKAGIYPMPGQDWPEEDGPGPF